MIDDTYSCLLRVWLYIILRLPPNRSKHNPKARDEETTTGDRHRMRSCTNNRSGRGLCLGADYVGLDAGRMRAGWSKEVTVRTITVTEGDLRM